MNGLQEVYAYDDGYNRLNVKVGGDAVKNFATGLKLLGHRYYDASAGRFLTRDPIKEDRNWHVYCDSDPIGGADPWGLAKIYVAWRKVANVGHHAYLIIEDDATGNMYTVARGGPLASQIDF